MGLRVEVERGPRGGVLSLVARASSFTHTFAGYCRYWIAPEGFGGFQCQDHEGFGGPVAFWWDGASFTKTSERPPEGAEVLEGEWLPDDEWRKR